MGMEFRRADVCADRLGDFPDTGLFIRPSTTRPPVVLKRETNSGAVAAAFIRTMAI